MIRFTVVGMSDALHPSQLPDDWEDQLGRAYDVFALKPVIPQRGVKRPLRNRSGQFMRRRNTVESMANAPSPYRSWERYPVPLYDLTRETAGGRRFPLIVYNNFAPYLDRRPAAARWNRETADVIRAARNNPDLSVTVFRPVPWIINHFAPGDTVVLSSGYAAATAKSRPRWRVITGTVPARELFTRSNEDLMRWEWRGREPFPNGGVVTGREWRGRR